MKTAIVTLCLAFAFTVPVYGADETNPKAFPRKLDAAGVDNFYQLSESVYSGSTPHGEEGFRFLSKLGVKTILSVDEVAPDVALAKKFGIGYVHVPIGNNAIKEAQASAIVKVAVEQPGPLFIHCHYGINRGPSAAAIVCIAQHGWTPEQATAWMEKAGTSSSCTGLYRDVRNFRAHSAVTPTFACPPIVSIPKGEYKAVQFVENGKAIKKVELGEKFAELPDPYADEAKEQRDARMQWWREAKFGMFIHWGVYAVPAGTWNGKQIPGIGEWIMNHGKIPCADYQAFAKNFNPVKYNADQWVRIAKSAGMKYIIITSKHHDGFTLFDSKASDWNVVKATPYGRDLLEPLADACRKHGLKLGFYYSQAQDWNNGGSAIGGKWDKAQQHDMDDYIDKISVPQVKEILTRYGEFPAVLWWDTPTDMNRQRAEKLITLLKLKPGIIHNNRLGGGFKGDTETPEQQIPATGFPGRDWETCMTMNDTWGYKSYDDHWKSTETLLRNLIDIASKGGNYLLNVGPTAEGLIPQPSIDRLADIGKWMNVNGDAIYGTTASPFKKLPFNGRCTRKPGKLYLHVFDWPTGGTIFIPMTSSISKAYLLTDPAKPLPVTSADNGQTIALPAEAPDKIASVIVAEIAGEPEVIVPPVQPVSQAADGSLKLDATEAILHGELKLEGKHKNQNIGYWLNAADWVEWPINITQPGKFTVTAEIAAQASGAFEIIVGDNKLKAKAPQTGGYGKFRKSRLGEIEIAAPGKITLVIKPIKEGWQPFNLATLTLAPVR